jgi:hypothetical protein
MPPCSPQLVHCPPSAAAKGGPEPGRRHASPPRNLVLAEHHPAIVSIALLRPCCGGASLFQTPGFPLPPRRPAPRGSGGGPPGAPGPARRDTAQELQPSASMWHALLAVLGMQYKRYSSAKPQRIRYGVPPWILFCWIAKARLALPGVSAILGDERQHPQQQGSIRSSAPPRKSRAAALARQLGAAALDRCHPSRSRAMGSVWPGGNGIGLAAVSCHWDEAALA